MMTLQQNLKQELGEFISKIKSAAQEVPLILVFGLGSYGDVLQITPLLTALKKRFPKANLILIHHDKFGQKFFTSTQILRHYFPVPSSAHYLLRSLLQDEPVDLIVECRYVIKYTLSPKSRFSREDIAFIQSAQKEQISWLPTIQNFPFDNDVLWRRAHEYGWSMYDLMAHTSGFATENFEALRIELPALADIPKKFHLPDHYVAVSNSAEWLPIKSNLWTKCLPHERMRQSLLFLQKAGISTVLLGIENDPGDYPVTHDLRGKTNLSEVAEIIGHAQLVLGPEGGLVNLAQALEKKSVVFFGSTPLPFFAFKTNINLEPTQCGGCWWSTPNYLRQCPLLLETPACTHSITPERILEAVQLGLSTIKNISS